MKKKKEIVSLVRQLSDKSEPNLIGLKVLCGIFSALVKWIIDTIAINFAINFGLYMKRELKDHTQGKTDIKYLFLFSFELSLLQ